MQCLVIILASTLLTAPPSPTPAATDELEGTWKITRIEIDGVALPEDQVRGMKLTFEKGRFTSLIGTTKQSGKFMIDSGKSPKTMDIMPDSGPDKDKTQALIYSLDGGVLKVCASEAGKDRPTEFVTKGKTGFSLMELKRE